MAALCEGLFWAAIYLTHQLNSQRWSDKIRTGSEPGSPRGVVVATSQRIDFKRSRVRRLKLQFSVSCAFGWSLRFPVLILCRLRSIFPVLNRGRPSRRQNDGDHHQRAKYKSYDNRASGNTIVPRSHECPRGKGQVKKRSSINARGLSALHNRGQYMEEDRVDQSRGWNDQAERRAFPTAACKNCGCNHKHGVHEKKPPCRHYDAQILDCPVLPAGKVLLQHVEKASCRDNPECPFVRSVM